MLGARDELGTCMRVYVHVCVCVCAVLPVQMDHSIMGVVEGCLTAAAGERHVINRQNMYKRAGSILFSFPYLAQLTAKHSAHKCPSSPPDLNVCV
jgi:hypothetical protein